MTRKYKKRGSTTTTLASSALMQSWIEIYRAVLKSDSEVLDQRIKDHIRLTEFKESEVWVDRRVNEVIRMSDPEIKALILSVENGLMDSYKATLTSSQYKRMLRQRAPAKLEESIPVFIKEQAA